jgi:hypothetical protein
MSKQVVKVILTNGFGNNIFQYVYARLIADINDAHLMVEVPPKARYVIPSLEAVGVPMVRYSLGDKIYDISDKNATVDLTNVPCPGFYFLVHGYFEDYKLFKPHRDKIKSWFPNVPVTNTKDLVLHLRLGDRLFYHNTYGEYVVTAESFRNAIQTFDFERLHIVTDMKEWRNITKTELEGMKFHADKPSAHLNDLQIAVDYFNSLVDMFSQFNPLVRVGNKIHEDFNYIRSFDKILFQHGTLAYWAAFLTAASRVGVYGPWRPMKGKKNKNLGKTDLPGWFSWE